MRRQFLAACLLAASFALTTGACKYDNGTPLQAPDRADAEPDASAGMVPPDAPTWPDALSALPDVASVSDVSILSPDAPSLPDGPPSRLDLPVGETSSQQGEAGSGRATLVLDRSAVNLGTLDLNTTGVASLTVTNVGADTSGPVTVGATEGIVVAGCSGILRAGVSCTLSIMVTPTAIGVFTGAISISASPGALTPLLATVIATVTTGGGLFSVHPSAIDLSSVQVGVRAPPQTITVTASTAISDLVVGVSGVEISIDRTASTCTAALAAGASCIVVVDFTAMSTGAKSDSVIIGAGGTNGKVVSVPITAADLAAARLVMAPSGTQSFVANVGRPSSAIPFGLANAGDVATGAISIAVTGPDAADFVATSDCLILAPLSGCTIEVVWTPVAARATAETATLTATDTGPGASSVSVALVGGGLTGPASPTITPSTADLGSVLVGATGAATVFTVTNGAPISTGTLTVSVSSTEFVVVGDTCSGASLASAENCTVSIALHPTTPGAKSAILVVAQTGGASAAKTLTGTGVTGPSPSATPAAIDFGNVIVGSTAPSQTITIKNNGGTATGVLTLDKTGSFAVFPVSANTCTTALAPAASCTFAVGFSPTAAQGEAASFTVTDGSVSVTVALSGAGV